MGKRYSNTDNRIYSYQLGKLTNWLDINMVECNPKKARKVTNCRRWFVCVLSHYLSENSKGNIDSRNGIKFMVVKIGDYLADFKDAIAKFDKENDKENYRVNYKLDYGTARDYARILQNAGIMNESFTIAININATMNAAESKVDQIGIAHINETESCMKATYFDKKKEVEPKAEVAKVLEMPSVEESKPVEKVHTKADTILDASLNNKLNRIIDKDDRKVCDMIESVSNSIELKEGINMQNNDKAFEDIFSGDGWTKGYKKPAQPTKTPEQIEKDNEISVKEYERKKSLVSDELKRLVRDRIAGKKVSITENAINW